MPSHNIHHGLMHNIVHGIKRGLSGVVQDSTSGIFCPANAAQWTTTMAAAGITSGNPFALYLSQEASGNLADSIGSNTLTAANTPLYAQSIPGWTRKAVGNDTAGGTAGFSGSGGTFPDVSTTSQLYLAYILLTVAPNGARDLLGMGTVVGGTARANLSNSVPNYTAVMNNVSSAAGTSNPGTTSVRPVVIRHNFTASTQAVFTDQEKISPAFHALSSTTGLTIGSGNFQGNTSPFRHLYGASWSGSAAELSDTQVRSLLRVLGWSPAW